MMRRLSASQWLCAMLLLPLFGGPAFGVGEIVGTAAPSCPYCGAPGGPSCPANAKYFGYYPTLWRRWPGTEPMPAGEPNRAPRPGDVQVPSPEQEAVGPTGANNAPGTTGASAAPVPDVNSPAAPHIPGGSTVPNPNSPVTMPPSGAGTGSKNIGTPMLNGMPVPNGTQLPNGNPLPLPNGASPNVLPPPSSDSTTKGTQLFMPMANPIGLPPRQTSDDSLRSNSPWPGAAPGALSQATAMPTALQPSDIQAARVSRLAPAPLTIQPAMGQPNELPSAAADAGQPIIPVTTPEAVPQWPPANMLRAAAVKAGYQTSERAAPYPIAPTNTSSNTTILRGQSMARTESSDSLTVVAERPARAISINSDDWSADHSFATSASPNAGAPAAVAARLCDSGRFVSQSFRATCSCAKSIARQRPAGGQLVRCEFARDAGPHVSLPRDEPPGIEHKRCPLQCRRQFGLQWKLQFRTQFARHDFVQHSVEDRANSGWKRNGRHADARRHGKPSSNRRRTNDNVDGGDQPGANRHSDDERSAAGDDAVAGGKQPGRESVPGGGLRSARSRQSIRHGRRSAACERWQRAAGELCTAGRRRIAETSKHRSARSGEIAGLDAGSASAPHDRLLSFARSGSSGSRAAWRRRIGRREEHLVIGRHEHFD